MLTYVFDIETNGLYAEASVIHCLVLKDVDSGAVYSCHDHGMEEGVYAALTVSMGLDMLEKADMTIAHNGIAYDIPVIKKITGRQLDPSMCIDTLVLSRLGRPVRPGGHSLAAWAGRLGEAPDKVENDDWSTWTPHMQERCEADVEITHQLYERLRPLLTLMPDAVATEMQVAHLVSDMVLRGFKLDVAAARKVLDEKLTYKEEKLKEFQSLFPPVLMPTQTVPKVYKTARNALNVDPGVEFTPLKVEEFTPTARQQVARRLFQKYGWKAKILTETGLPKIDEDTLRALPYPEAREFADYLVNDKLISQIDGNNGWLKYLDANDRVHPSFNPTGANTHRSSCSRPPLQQVSTAPEMRKPWISESGWLVGIDAAGLELRCLAHYLAALDDGEYANILINGDIHAHVQSLIGFATRDKTKNAEYGWLYGAGNSKLGQIARQDAQSGNVTIDKRITNAKLGKALRRNMEEGVTGLGTLVKQVQAKAHTGKLRGLDGRPLWVRSEHSALNLLLQSCGAILIKTAWSLFDLPEGAHTVMQVHDEWQIECPTEACAIEVGQHVVECIKLAGEQLKLRCPLDGSYHIGENWNETH
tara:strand:- start:193 stop:1956 length:1764 start_codon:yes stop_codon:yes gene_type:complete